jgi:hypothetical protein
MDTEGHKKICEKAGTPFLKAALESEPDLREAYPAEQLGELHAFHLGNWLTDLQQVYDEVFFSSRSGELHGILDLVRKLVKKAADHYVLEVTADLQAKIKALNLPEKARPHGMSIKDWENCWGSAGWFACMAHTTRDATQNFAADAGQLGRSAALQAVGEAEHFVTEVANAINQMTDTAALGVMTLMGKPGGMGHVAQGIRDAIRVAAYFKFVKPPAEELDTDSFLYVFDHFFPAVTWLNLPENQTCKPRGPLALRGAYYPHQHMDRWPLDKTEYKTEALRSQTRKHQPARDPGIYPYMRDYLEYIAGHLADLDMHWAEPTFNPSARKPLRPTSSNPEELKKWRKENDLRLAQLGHALHAAEDFFAHSTFIEHAVRLTDQREGKHYLSLFPGKLIGEESLEHAREFVEKFKSGLGGPVDQVAALLEDKDYTRFQRRLLKFDYADYKGGAGPKLRAEPRPEDRAKAEDPNVVTGYYDWRDTLISLTELGEEAFLFKAAGKGLSFLIKKTTEAEVEIDIEHRTDPRRYIREMADLVDDPKHWIKGKGTELEEKVKKELEEVCKEVWKNLRIQVHPEIVSEAAARTAAERVLPPYVPESIRKSAIQSIVMLKSKIRIAKWGFDALESLEFLSKLAAGPEVALAELLKKLIGEKLLSYVASSAFQVADEAWLEWIGANRIGCHSLIAKDHKDDYLNDKALACAMGVDYYVITTLLRWQHRCTPISCSKKPPQGTGGSGKGSNLLNTSPWLDWTELIEYFLRHPATGGGNPVIVAVRCNVWHLTKDGDQLKTLAARYAATAVDPKNFDWQRIARANYNTDYPAKINALLRNLNIGYPVAHTNYAWKENVWVLIPDQIGFVIFHPRKDLRQTWFYHVMTKGWEVMRDGVKSGRTGKNGPAHDHVFCLLKPDDVTKIVDRGDSVHEDYMARYRREGETMFAEKRKSIGDSL